MAHQCMLKMMEKIDRYVKEPERISVEDYKKSSLTKSQTWSKREPAITDQ